MSIIYVENLFQCSNTNSYQKIEQEFFVKHGQFNLEKLYILEVSLDEDFSHRYPLFETYDFSEKAMIFKLDNTYYFTSISRDGEFKSYVSEIFQIDFDDSKLSQFLEKKEIKNHITLPIEIEINQINNIRHSGVYFYSTALEKKEFNALVRLMSQDYQTQHSTAYIDFYPINYENAFEMVEKQYLEQQMSESHTLTKNKVKL
jgi:hypothetical protein